jgi:hypothetical protein
VDPLDPNVPIAPIDLIDPTAAKALGIKLEGKDQQRMIHSMASWMLSQFLHGEQGALLAAAQVTESVQWFDGKLYQVNDNLFVILDALLSDRRWDMKFLGMQIMVEGLALGAFALIHRESTEPLLKAMLRAVIQDEARHVHYGVVALRDHVRQELTESERNEREDWAFEVALLMRNRFLAYEVYDEWFAGTSVSRKTWRELISRAPGMQRFRHTMFQRLVPNIREIGLLTDRIRPHYERAGLGAYFSGLSADRLTEADMLTSSHTDSPAAA